MSKFCGNCGAQNDDNAMNCNYCGAAFIDSQYQAPVNAAPASKGFNVNDIIAKIPFINNLSADDKAKYAKLLPVAGIAIVGLIVLIIIISSISSGTGAKGAVKKYFDAIEGTNVKQYIKLMPASQTIYFETDEDDENALTEEEMVEDQLKVALEELEEKYGDKVKIKVKVTKVDDMKNSELKIIEDLYSFNEDLSEIEIKKGVEVDFDIKLKGKEDNEETDGTAIVIKEDGKWKVYDVDIDY